MRPPLTSARNAGRAAQVGIIVPLMFGIITQRIRRRPSKLIPGRRCERPPAGHLPLPLPLRSPTQ